MSRRDVLLLSALASEALALCALTAVGDLHAHVLWFAFLFIVAVVSFVCAYRLLSENESFARIALVTVCLRLPMLFTTPSLSDDVWRYLHDGRAQLAGTSPYAYAPADARTAPFRGSEFERINHRDLVTIYPPVAQASFLLNALFGSRILMWRLLLIAAELATLIMLAQLLERRALASRNLALFAWHPLAVVEGVGSAHLDPIGIALLMAGLWAAAQNRALIAGALLGLSTGFKLVSAPLMIVTRHICRPQLLAAAITTLALAYAIYWSGGSPFGSLGTFAVSWEANASIYALLAFITDGHRARILAATLLICIGAVLRVTRLRDEQRMAAFMLAILLLSPVVHPWYLLWLLAFVPLLTLGWLRQAALAWTVTIVLSYLPYDLRLLEYLPLYGILGFALLKAVRQGSLRRTLYPSPGRTWRISI